MYVDVSDFGGIIGALEFMRVPTPDEVTLVTGDDASSAAAVDAVVGAGYSTMSDWFFQMVFVAATASIVSGAVAERVKLWSFFIFTLVLTAFDISGRGRVDMGRRLGLTRWDSRTSLARPSSTPPEAGLRLPG